MLPREPRKMVGRSGAMRGRATGSLVADRSGSATPYAMFNLQERGEISTARIIWDRVIRPL